MCTSILSCSYTNTCKIMRTGTKNHYKHVHTAQKHGHHVQSQAIAFGLLSSVRTAPKGTGISNSPCSSSLMFSPWWWLTVLGGTQVARYHAMKWSWNLVYLLHGKLEPVFDSQTIDIAALTFIARQFSYQTRTHDTLQGQWKGIHFDGVRTSGKQLQLWLLI